MTENELRDIMAEAEKFTKHLAEEEALRKEYEALPFPDLDKWHDVGVVGVDAGMVWLGDPCYILALPHSKDSDIKSLSEVRKLPSSLGEDWGEFCHKMSDDRYIGIDRREFYKEHIAKGVKPVQDAHQFNYELGHAGLGVCVGSGYGDGTYPVKVKYNSEGRIAEVKVVFIDDNEENLTE